MYLLSAIQINNILPEAIPLLLDLFYTFELVTLVLPKNSTFRTYSNHVLKANNFHRFLMRQAQLKFFLFWGSCFQYPRFFLSRILLMA